MCTLRVFAVVLFLVLAGAASKPHIVGFGSPQPVKVFAGPSEDKTIDITVRALYVDTKADALPDDPRKPAKWQWQLGGWLLVDLGSGKITQLKLPDFEPVYSDVSWYRDYAAYCGVTSYGERLLAVVAQIGVRKALYRKELDKASGGDLPGSDCAAPHWDRRPARVTFLPKTGEKFTVNVSGHVTDAAPESSAEEQ
jgi:hypothetical protein